MKLSPKERRLLAAFRMLRTEEKQQLLELAKNIAENNIEERRCTKKN